VADAVGYYLTHYHTASADTKVSDNYLFVYRIGLNSAKTTSSVTLPNATRIKIAALSLASGGFLPDSSPTPTPGPTSTPTPTPTAGPTATPTPVPPGGLVAWWKLDESSGTTAFDATTNHFDGTLINAPTWQPAGGHFNGALQFNGTNNRVDVAAATLLNEVNYISFTGWFKTSQAATAFASVIRHNGHFTALQLTNSNTGQVAYWTSATLRVLTFSWTYNNNAWHHYAAVYDKDLGLKVYVDGAQVASSATYLGALNTSAAQFCLGSNEGNQEFYNGLLDDVRVYPNPRPIRYHPIAGFRYRRSHRRYHGHFPDQLYGQHLYRCQCHRARLVYFRRQRRKSGSNDGPPASRYGGSDRQHLCVCLLSDAHYG
jgi:hypothetical protein